MFLFASNKMGYLLKFMLIYFQMIGILNASLIKDHSNKMSMSNSNDSYKDMSNRKLSNEQQMKLDWIEKELA